MALYKFIIIIIDMTDIQQRYINKNR